MYFDELKKQIEAAKRWKKLAIISFCIVGVCILVRMFVPSRDTMIEIMIAKTATVENVTNGVNFTVDTFKEIVDYVVNAINSLK